MVGLYFALEDFELFDEESGDCIDVKEGDIISVLGDCGEKGVLIGYQGRLTTQFWYSIEDKIKEVK